MPQITKHKQVLSSILWKQGDNTAFYYIGLTLIGAVLIAASAQIQIPMYPVPVTLQTFAVILIAMSAGWRLGLASSMTYLFMGAMGLPVFAGMSGGFAYLIGPTAGYLIAFPFAAVVAGWLTQRIAGKNFFLALFVSVLAGAIMLTLGCLHLASYVGLHQAFIVGVQPFLLDELCKAIMVAVIIPRVWRAER